MTDAEFLNWVADRFVNRYNEDPNVDFVLALRRIGKKVEKFDNNRIAIAKMTKGVA